MSTRVNQTGHVNKREDSVTAEPRIVSASQTPHSTFFRTMLDITRTMKEFYLIKQAGLWIERSSSMLWQQELHAKSKGLYCVFHLGVGVFASSKAGTVKEN